MLDFLSNHVRPTRRFLRDLGLSFPTANLRGIAAALTATECVERDLDIDAHWWGGAAGMRRADSATDFYRQIQAEAVRQGRGTGAASTRHLLPQAIDAERLQSETAVLAVRALRAMVLDLVARSLRDGCAYTAVLTGHKVTALVRADNGAEAYLAVVAEGFIRPKVIAIILNSVPGISADDWQAEPGGVADIEPQRGQVIWSTILPAEVQAEILARSDKEHS